MRDGPVTLIEFSHAMEIAGSLEPNPDLAVAVSGGADSMALAILSHEWAKMQGGRMTALIVDHGLRKISRDEAATTANRLKALGIPSQILSWLGDKPKTGIQSKARSARYDLLNKWCHKNGVLHLLVGHHANDQAETFLMRVKHGSGPDGLAAMSPVRTLSACQLIRPLLTFPKSRLIATLRDRGIDWVEDPSNNDPKYARTTIRRDMADAGHDTLKIADGAKRFKRVRLALESQVSEWIARHATLYPEGYIQLDLDCLQKATSEIRLRILSRAAMAIGGNTYPPSIAAVERLDQHLAGKTSATLGGSRFVVQGHKMTVCREARNLPAETQFNATHMLWDNRFLIAANRPLSACTVQAWSPEIARLVPREKRPNWFQDMPDCARYGFPIIRSNDDFKLLKSGCIENKEVFVQFTPKIPLSGNGFSVA